MRLALGTVQFGMSYGVANTEGKMAKDVARHIIQRAEAAGLNTLDTAIVYGDSEKCLGGVGVNGWDIITKLPPIPHECSNVISWVDEQLRASLNNLGVKKLKGLMLHSPSQLLGLYGQELWFKMQSLRGNGVVEKIGFSIYEPQELDLLWGKFRPDIIQAPYNVFDQRLKSSGWLLKLNKSGVEIHVRSVFLQGLLLMSEECRPRKFCFWKEQWDLWNKWLDDNDLSPLEGCLYGIMSEEMIDYFVVGVDSVKHFDEILKVVKQGRVLANPKLGISDQALINPSNW